MPRALPAPLLMAILLGGAASAMAQTPATAPDPGFSVEVRGAGGETDSRRLGAAVLAALPEPLRDPTRNFTRHTAYQAGVPYRIVLLFHGPEEVPADALCGAPQAAETKAPPPRFNNIQTTTHLTAAFCGGPNPLSTASDQTTGELDPGQVSFRFLVADVVKQLFPGGFDVMPGQPGTVAAPE